MARTSGRPAETSAGRSCSGVGSTPVPRTYCAHSPCTPCISTTDERHLHPVSSSLAQVQRAAALCLDLKANNVVVLDLDRVSNATDYFLIASGSSDTHVRAIAEHVVDELKKEGVRAHHVEGLAQGRWVLARLRRFRRARLPPHVARLLSAGTPVG